MPLRELDRHVPGVAQKGQLVAGRRGLDRSCRHGPRRDQPREIGREVGGREREMQRERSNRRVRRHGRGRIPVELDYAHPNRVR